MGRLTATFIADGPLVVLVLNGVRAIEADWRLTKDILREFDRHIRNLQARQRDPDVLPLPETGIKHGDLSLTFRSELDRVQCIGGGVLLFDAPAPIARQLWQGWRAKALDVEELENANAIAFDAALLHRSGAPLGLSNNPLIRAEAKSLAQSDDVLRKSPDRRTALPFGAPSVRPITKIEQAQRLLASPLAADRHAMRAALLGAKS